METKTVQRVYNLTPHPINFHIKVEGHDDIITLQSDGIARCKEIQKQIGEYCFPIQTNEFADDYSANIPMMIKEFGEVVVEKFEGDSKTISFPIRDQAIFIVSAIVAQAMKNSGRDDIFIVNETVRDDKGNIIGAKSIAKI